MFTVGTEVVSSKFGRGVVTAKYANPAYSVVVMFEAGFRHLFTAEGRFFEWHEGLADIRPLQEEEYV